MKKILFVVTRPETARAFLKGQLGFLRQSGLWIGLASNPEPGLEAVGNAERIDTFRVRMRRRPAPVQDLASLRALLRVVRSVSPDILNASTPKAGFLGMIAGRLAGVPTRIYLARGLRLETTAGVRRRVLSATERLSVRCAHRVVCVSPSLAEAYQRLGLAPAEKLAIVGRGSSNGVDTKNFSPRRSGAVVEELRRRLGLKESDRVVGFVGRLTNDKGLGDAVKAFREVIYPKDPNARLVLVGADDIAGAAAMSGGRGALARIPGVVDAGLSFDMAPYYGLMDVLLFPSLREGMPNAVLEASASEVPVVGYRVTGVRDAVVDGVSGRLCEKGDWRSLAKEAATYLADGGLRRAHGAAGRQYVMRFFEQEKVWSEWLRFYRSFDPSARAEPVA